MNIESNISNMMKMNVLARLWHWHTVVAQHHTTYEQFLTQNETLTDSFVESCLGNDMNIDLNKVLIQNAKVSDYSLSEATSEIKNYRSNISELKKKLEKSDIPGTDELITILDDVTELSSKTLYLLKLK